MSIEDLPDEEGQEHVPMQGDEEDEGGFGDKDPEDAVDDEADG
jgi:hypothetical protein